MSIYKESGRVPISGLSKLANSTIVLPKLDLEDQHSTLINTPKNFGSTTVEEVRFVYSANRLTSFSRWYPSERASFFRRFYSTNGCNLSRIEKRSVTYDIYLSCNGYVEWFDFQIVEVVEL